MKMISKLYAHQIQSIVEIILDDRVVSAVNAKRIRAKKKIVSF